MPLILHHYDASPFSEKVRLVLGLKGLAWHSVVVPEVMPKPDYVPLTGGYRRVPALQIGAHIHCDTARILAELEARHPAPALYPSGRPANEIIARWAESQLFWAAAHYVTGLNADLLPQRFHVDRASMRGREAPPPDAVRKAGMRALAQLRPAIHWIQGLLHDGRRHLLGPVPELADFAVYHGFWMLGQFPRNALDDLVPGGPIRSWMDRMAAIGHGSRSEMTAAEAQAMAAHCMPEVLDPGLPMDGLAAGDMASIRPEDRGSPAVTGRILRLTADEVALARTDPVMDDLVVHFPRLGYLLRAAATG
ncbi:glutathione S-transferase family protein [Marinibaculum pumilum]|uniref:Glutathione S-transferase family protein n=1 Tax=Marinibaculum pumilum TaxID=1766165 RepID=A0ABV7L402_9PROT